MMDVVEDKVDDAVAADDPVEQFTAEPQVEEVSAQPEGEEIPTEPQLDPTLLQRAEREYGLSADMLEGYDGPRAERLLSAMDARLSAPPEQPIQPGQPQEQPAAQPAVIPAEFAPLKLELPEDLDESFRAPFQGIVDHINTGMQQLHQFRQQATQEIQGLNLVRRMDSFDQFIAGLGDEWKDVYGTGRTLDMDPKSTAFQARFDVFTGGDQLAGNAARWGQPIPELTAWQRTHGGKHFDRLGELERKKLETKMNKHSRTLAEKPTAGKAPAVDPREEAVAAYRGER